MKILVLNEEAYLPERSLLKLRAPFANMLLAIKRQIGAFMLVCNFREGSSPQGARTNAHQKKMPTNWIVGTLQK
jgi:hypothetical protein